MTISTIRKPFAQFSSAQLAGEKATRHRFCDCSASGGARWLKFGVQVAWAQAFKWSSIDQTAGSTARCRKMALNRNEHELCSHRGSRLQGLLPPSTGGGLLCLACLQCLFTANNFAVLWADSALLWRGIPTENSNGASFALAWWITALPCLYHCTGTSCLDICPFLVVGFAMPDVPPYITALAQVVWTFGPVWWITALPCLALPCLALPCLGDQC